MLSLSCGIASGEDWPGWRGPDRTDVSRETGLLRDWPTQGPPLVWRFENAGAGYAGFAIVDGRLLTMGTRDEQTILLALDATTGAELWASPISKVFENRWGDGPRGTPTVAGNQVFALTGEGDLVCCELSSGKVVWSRNLKELGGKIPQWGYAESVLVDGDRVICTPGGPDGALAALSRDTGALIWQSVEIDDPAHYSSPIKVQIDGETQYVQLTKSNLFGVRAATGELLWRSDWNGRIAVIPTPIYSDGHVYATSGYGVGCKLVSLADGEATDVYANKKMENHHGGVVLVGNHVYGYSDGPGWACQDFMTGELAWNDKNSLGKGAVTCADGMLYCIDENEGEVVLIEASTAGFREHGRFTLAPQTKIRKPAGKIWTHPVISNKRLYLRDQNLIYCFDIAASEAAP